MRFIRLTIGKMHPHMVTTGRRRVALIVLEAEMIQLVKTAKEATVTKSLPLAFDWAERCVKRGVTEDAYVSPVKAPGGWRVDARDEDDNVIGYLKVTAD